MLSISISTATAAILLSSVNFVTAQNGFRQIAIPDTGGTNPIGVVLPSICIGNFIVPKTMYTIEPADVGETEVKILTNPPDLVEVGYDDNEGLIYFKFIQEISEGADDAGVIIQFPADQLESVNSCCSQSVQIKEGFTNFQSLTVSTNAVVDASFAVEQDSDMVVGVFTGAEANVKVTETSGTKNTNVAVIATDNGKVNIDGDISTLSCIDQSDCMIGGVISDPANSRSRGRSNIQTTSCEDIDVSDDSICQSKTPTVTVDVDGDLVISGVKEDCVGGEDLDGLGGLFDPLGTDAPSIASVPTISPQPSQSPDGGSKSPRPTESPNTRTTPSPVSPTLPPTTPTTAPVSAAFDGVKRGVLSSIVGTVICGGAFLLLVQ